MAEILEMIMVIMFGVSWPLNIYKLYKSRTAKSYSVIFYILIDIGYVCGIISKIISHNITYVFAFYILNFVMVALSIAIYYRNLYYDKHQPVLEEVK